MASVTNVEYTRDFAKVYLSDGRQSPKLAPSEVNAWITENKDKVKEKA